MSIILLFQFIPMPVLYGVFLYMGVASLNGVQVSAASYHRIDLRSGNKTNLET